MTSTPRIPIGARRRPPSLILFSLDLVNRYAVITIFALTFALTACDNTFHDFSYMWADKVHADSPTGSYVAYVQEETTSSSVVIVFEGGSALAMQFKGTHLPLELKWLDPTTLEVRYPREVPPTCAEDAVDHIVDKVRVVPVQI